jgi:L-threonylcarbamoyladenylate synthase
MGVTPNHPEFACEGQARGVIESPTPETLARAIALLGEGKLIGLPTETVYGLAGDATNAEAIAIIYALKGRPRFNPLIAHVEGLAAGERHAHFTPLARALAQAFWPGPLTLVLARRADSPIAELACAGLSSIALRAPDHPVAQSVLRAFGRPLVAPSANISGHVSPTTAQHVEQEFAADAPLTLDGGQCRFGLESSVVAIVGDVVTLLRAGAITRAEIERVTGAMTTAGAGDAVASPGMLDRHYAPAAALRLNAQEAALGEVLLGFGAVENAALNLSPRGDVREAAANLYAYLRQLDWTGAAAIAVSPIPSIGLGEAINDRLMRAARGR